jgi:signal transduction histidine kinase
MLMGMIISFFSIFMYLALFSDYSHSDFTFINLDYLFFRLARKTIKIPLPVLSRIMNAGMGLYLIAVPLFVFEFTDNNRRITAKIVFLLFFIVYYLIFYDPNTAYYIYLDYHASSKQIRYHYILDLIDQLNQLGLILYLFHPSYLLYRHISEIHIAFIRRQLTLLAGCLIGITLLFYRAVFFSPFIHSVDNAINYGLWMYNNTSSVKTYDAILPLATTSVLFLVFFSFFNFRLGSAAHFFTDRRTDRLIAQMNEILSDSLHSQKNLLFSINILAGNTHAAGDNVEKLREEIKKIDDLSRSSLEKISEQLDALREIRMKLKDQELIGLIEKAVEKVNLPKRIEIFRNYRVKDRHTLVCRLDEYHITQVFVNIISNAMEAIEESGREEGIIIITATAQFQWALVGVQDNGIGIRKKSLRRVFEPWYSEKAGHYHRGLGLSYVYKIIKAHFGIIRLESRYGKGSTVYIMLPRSKQHLGKSGVLNGKNKNPNRRR